MPKVLDTAANELMAIAGQKACYSQGEEIHFEF